MNNDQSDTGAETGDESDGRRRVTDEQILDALSEGMDRMNVPALSTADVADLLPVSRQAVKRRLDDLAAENRVGKNQAGRNRVWWILGEEPAGEQFDLDLVVDEGDLSDEKLLELFRNQMDISDLPADIASEFWERRAEPANVPDELIFAALEKHVDYAGLPDSVTSRIAREVHAFDPGFWAKCVRFGTAALAGTTLFGVVGSVLLAVDPSRVPAPAEIQMMVGVTSTGLSTVFLVLAAVLFLIGIGTMGAGIWGQNFTTADAPGEVVGRLKEAFGRD